MKFDEVQVKELIGKVDPSALGSEGVDFFFSTRTDADEEYGRLFEEIRNELGDDEWRRKVADLDAVVGDKLTYVRNWWCVFGLLMGYAHGAVAEYFRLLRQDQDEGDLAEFDARMETMYGPFNMDLHSLLGAVQFAQKYADGEL